MMTTVTISDELRKKLKRLAAKYDTNQAEIIRKSLEIFERYENNPQESIMNKKEEDNKNLISNQQVSSFDVKLEQITKEFELKYPKIAKYYKNLRKNPKRMEEITITNWELPFEE